MPALPKADPSLVQGMADQYADSLSAYNVCLEYEKEVAIDADKLRFIRIPCFLLIQNDESTNLVISTKERGRGEKRTKTAIHWSRHLSSPTTNQ